jgi:hypothetical protein
VTFFYYRQSGHTGLPPSPGFYSLMSVGYTTDRFITTFH